LRSLIKRRPSAPMAISLVALFMSVGGVGYAATSLPSNSVGTAQIRSEAVTYKKIRPGNVGSVRLANEGVTYRKIHPGAVGKVRANLKQLQARLASTCGAGTAVGGVDQNGKVTCNPALPGHTAIAAASADVGATAANVAAGTLPTGASYVAFSNPTVTMPATVATQHVTVTCTLSLGSAAQSRSQTVDTSTTDPLTLTIPLQQAGAAGPVSVACAESVPAAGTAPTGVRATASIDAIQTIG
jgi:hypothetical protein